MSTFITANTSAVPPPRWRNCFPLRHHVARDWPSALQISPLTGPLDRLSGRRVLALLDTENLTISCRNLGYELNYAKLGVLLAHATCSLYLHAVLSVENGDLLDRTHMESAGFQVHTRLIRYLPGGRKAANADNLFAFKAGALITRSTAEVVLLGSGDGQLCDDVVQCVKALPGERQVMTLSVAGATSSLLNARTHGLISANIEIGLDLLAPTWAGVAL